MDDAREFLRGKHEDHSIKMYVFSAFLFGCLSVSQLEGFFFSNMFGGKLGP